MFLRLRHVDEERLVRRACEGAEYVEKVVQTCWARRDNALGQLQVLLQGINLESIGPLDAVRFCLGTDLPALPRSIQECQTICHHIVRLACL